MQVSIREARNRFGVLLAQRQEITITRRGLPVARVLPVAPAFYKDKASSAAAGIRELSRGTTLAGLKLKDLIHEGPAEPT